MRDFQRGEKEAVIMRWDFPGTLHGFRETPLQEKQKVCP
jgi:hypothetical protein